MSNLIPEHELPNWMKQAQRSVDWGALLVLAFALLAGWSFLTNSQISATTANEHFVFQASDIAQAMREGIFYPRWSPYAISGYGAPIPHYYPQGAAYFIAIIDVLFTNDLSFALRIVYLIGTCIAAASLYAFVTQRGTALMGVIAALAYLFNPYIGLTVPYLLGDFALFLGLALIPLLLWIVNRLLLRQQAVDVALLAITTAIFIVTIPRLLPQAVLLVFLIVGLDYAQKPHRERLLTIVAGALLGLGIAAFYWLPAILERNLVNWYPHMMPASPQIIRFPEIFSQASFLDTGFLTHENYFSLGLVLVILALSGAVGLIYKREGLGFHAAYLLYGTALLAVLFIFPVETELLASISLCMAIGGAYIAKFLQGRFGAILSATLLLTIGIFALPYWFVPSAPLPIVESNAQAQINYEKSGYGVGVLPNGLAIPSNVAPYTESLLDTRTVEESNRISATGISPITEEGYHDLYQVLRAREGQIIYRRAYFEGWEAWLGNRWLNINRTENGLMSFVIPAENTSLSLQLGTTFLRSFAWFVSIVALLSSAFFWWLRWRQSEVDFYSSPLLSSSETRAVSIAFILLLAFHLAQPYVFNLPPRYSLQNATYVREEVDASLQLLAYEIRDNRLYLYWESSRPSLNQYQIRLRLMADENTVLQTAYTHPNYFPTNRWLRGFIVPHSYDLPAGDYDIFVDVYRCEGICVGIGNPVPSIELRLE